VVVCQACRLKELPDGLNNSDWKEKESLPLMVRRLATAWLLIIHEMVMVMMMVVMMRWILSVRLFSSSAEGILDEVRTN
jgi:hypothetical protein